MSALEQFRQELQQIEWSRYQDLSWASQVPNRLAMFATGQGAAEDLEHDLLPQTSLHDITVATIPFLITIVSEGWEREKTYDVLWSISICAGANYDTVSPLSTMSAPRLRRLAVECRSRLAEGRDAYLRDIADTTLSECCRKSALGTLCRIPGLAEGCSSTLSSIYLAATPEFRAVMVEYAEVKRVLTPASMASKR